MDLWATVAAYGGLCLGLLNLVKDVIREYRRGREHVTVRISQSKILNAPSEKVIAVQAVNRSDHAVRIESMSLQAKGDKRKLWVGPAPDRGSQLPQTLNAHGAYTFHVFEREIRTVEPKGFEGRRLSAIVHVSTGASFSSSWMTVDWSG